MEKIIHLSDLHVGHEDCGTKFRALIDNISFLKQPANNYIVLITGDIVENANHPEYIEEAVEGIEKLKERGYKVLVIPGNHDYGTGTAGNKKFIALFKEKYFKSKDISYPKLDLIGDIAFMGLDSTAEELHWIDRFLCEGELGNGQLMRLENMLNRQDVLSRKKVVYLHHHPFDFKFGMQLRDSDDLRKIIENKIDMLLFGHYHVDPASAGKIFHGKWGIKRCYNAGTSTHKNGHPGHQRVIDLSDADPRMDYDGNFIRGIFDSHKSFLPSMIMRNDFPGPLLSGIIFSGDSQYSDYFVSNINGISDLVCAVSNSKQDYLLFKVAKQQLIHSIFNYFL